MIDFKHIGTHNTWIQRLINYFLIILGKFTGLYYYLFQITEATKKPSTLIMTCIDYRLIDDYVIVLDQLNLTHDYDQFILAGASLAFTDDSHKSKCSTCKVEKTVYNTVGNDLDFDLYQKAYFDHLLLAIQVHHIKKVMIIDHEDCGAYKLYYHNNYDLDTHRKNIKAFVKKVKKFLKKRRSMILLSSKVITLSWIMNWLNYFRKCDF